MIMFLHTLMRKQGFLLIQLVTIVHTSAPTTTSIISLNTPPVIKADQPPKKTQPTFHKNSPLGSLILKAQGHRNQKTSTDAKSETVPARAVAVGTLDETQSSTASLNSRKFNDSKKGKLQTATMAQTIVSSDSGATHTLLSSQPINHSLSSQKDGDSSKGQVISVGDNTPIADVTSLATDPSYLSSITAPAVNVSLMSQGEIQAEISVSKDPSVKTQADDVEDTQSITNKAFRNSISCYHQGGENVQMNAKTKAAQIKVAVSDVIRNATAWVPQIQKPLETCLLCCLVTALVVGMK